MFCQKLSNRDKSPMHSPRPVLLNGNCAHRDAGMDDIKIKHALKATAIQKPYPKIVHAGARYQLVC